MFDPKYEFLTKDELVDLLYEQLHGTHFSPTTREDILHAVDHMLRRVHQPDDETKAQTMRLLCNDLEKMINPTVIRDFLVQLPNSLDEPVEARP